MMDKVLLRFTLIALVIPLLTFLIGYLMFILLYMMLNIPAIRTFGAIISVVGLISYWIGYNIK